MFFLSEVFTGYTVPTLKMKGLIRGGFGGYRADRAELSTMYSIRGISHSREAFSLALKYHTVYPSLTEAFHGLYVEKITHPQFVSLVMRKCVLSSTFDRRVPKYQLIFNTSETRITLHLINLPYHDTQHS